MIARIMPAPISDSLYNSVFIINQHSGFSVVVFKMAVKKIYNFTYDGFRHAVIEIP